MTEESKEFVSVAEAAALLGVSRQYVDRLVRAGQLPHQWSAPRPGRAHMVIPFAAVAERKRRLDEADAGGRLSIEDVAAECGVAVETAKGWVKRGLIVGELDARRRRRFTPEEVAAWKARRDGQAKGST